MERRAFSRSGALRRPRPRQGVAALALVLPLLGLAGALAFAFARFRSGAAHQLAAIEARQDLQAVAEATLEAAATPGVVGGLLADPADKDRWLQAYRDGSQVAGVVIPEDAGLELDPPSMAPAGAGWTVAPVGVRTLEYIPSANRGVLRLQVEVAFRGRRAAFAHDYEFTLADAATGGLAVTLAEAPRERIFP